MDKLILSLTHVVPINLFSKNKQLNQSMKKETGIGIGIAIVVFVIIFGIISLPDEVLIESPSVDTSAVQIGEEKKIIVSSESISSTEQSEPAANPQGNVIKIKIKDGVGTGDR